MDTHLPRRSYAPRQTTPIGPSHFLSKSLSRPALEVNLSSPKIAGRDARYGIASQYQRVPKKHQKQLPSFMLKAAKKQKKNHWDFDAGGSAANRDTFFVHFSSRLLDRWCSFSLAIFPPPFTLIKETWKPVFPLYTSQKQTEKAHVLYEPWPSNMHAAWCRALSACQPASPANTVELRKSLGWWLLLSFRGPHKRHAVVLLVEKIRFLLFWERRQNRQSKRLTTPKCDYQIRLLPTQPQNPLHQSAVPNPSYLYIFGVLCCDCVLLEHRPCCETWSCTIHDNVRLNLVIYRHQSMLKFFVSEQRKVCWPSWILYVPMSKRFLWSPLRNW